MKLKSISKFVRANLDLIIPLILLIPLYTLLYKIYIPRALSFGCFDDCNNFMGGYFLLAGKQMFSEFFFNHQPFAAHISALIQAITNPENVFELILRHRQFILLFSFMMNALLIWRFRLPAFIFVLIYELSKFYLFGDRFLAEGIIVYPIIYLTGLTFLKLSKQKLFTIDPDLIGVDYLLLPIFAWFVIFMREPFIPLALALFALIIAGRKLTMTKFVAIATFSVLTILTLLSFNLSEYFFNVITVNFQAVLPSDIKADMFGNRFIQAILYPIYIFFYGHSNILRTLLIMVNLVFIANLFFLFKRKAYFLVISIILILGLANIRVVLPGAMFYEAFHMIVWYGLFIFITMMLLFSNYTQQRVFYGSILVLFVAASLFVGSESYFARERVDQQELLLTNFGEVIQVGEVVRKLSNQGDTLFLDGSDDLIYWQAQHQLGAGQAKLALSYKYSWYTSAMPHFKKYTDARSEMFRTSPPTFYKEFGTCPKKNELGELYRLPDLVKSDYVRLYKQGEPTCLFVHKNKFSKISEDQWRKAKEFLYEKN